MWTTPNLATKSTEVERGINKAIKKVLLCFCNVCIASEKNFLKIKTKPVNLWYRCPWIPTTIASVKNKTKTETSCTKLKGGGIFLTLFCCVLIQGFEVERNSH